MIPRKSGLAVCFRVVLFLVVFFFHQLHGTHFQRQSEQIDESVRIVVVVEITGCEACEGFAVQRVWGGRSSLDNIAFVQLEFHFSCHKIGRASCRERVSSPV